jgi:hypothetical protein
MIRINQKKGPSKADRSRMNRKIAGASDKKLARIAAAIERAAKVSMKEGGGKARIPSPPGTPPNVQTGTLRSSITFARSGRQRWIVGPTFVAKYGEKHEFGKDGLPPRPFMVPAAEKVLNGPQGRFK